MQINLTVGVMPGEVKQIVVESGKTVVEVLKEAGIEEYLNGKYECRYNCEEVDEEDLVETSGILLLSEKVKGASEEAILASSDDETSIKVNDIVRIINTDKYGRVVDILEGNVLAVNFNGKCEKVLIAEVEKVNTCEANAKTETEDEIADEVEAKTAEEVSAGIVGTGKKVIKLEVTEEEKSDIKEEAVNTVTKFLNEAAAGNKDMNVNIKIGKKIEIKVICER